MSDKKRFKYSLHNSESNEWLYKRSNIAFGPNPYGQLRDNISDRYGIQWDFNMFCGMTSSTSPVENDLIPISDDGDVRDLEDGETLFIYRKGAARAKASKEKGVRSPQLAPNPENQPAAKRVQQSVFFQIFVKVINS